MTYLKELESAIVKVHGCEATAVDSVRVEETFQGKIVWSGEVEIFALTGCTRANRCYAWGLPNERGALEIATVLEISPVDSAAMAVRVALASGARTTRAGGARSSAVAQALWRDKPDALRGDVG